MLQALTGPHILPYNERCRINHIDPLNENPAMLKFKKKKNSKKIPKIKNFKINKKNKKKLKQKIFQNKYITDLIEFEDELVVGDGRDCQDVLQQGLPLQVVVSPQSALLQQHHPPTKSQRNLST